MAYLRRYLAGQLAVTVDIAQKAVTSDKLGDGSVGPTQLQDDSVNTEKIIDGQVKADDLGVLAVTTPKIQEGAVTESKLADGAVTSDKLGADVQQSVRPFVPGLPTAEIGDGAITAVKLGAASVETAKLKDGAVSSDKIGAQAVTNGKIAPDSIGSDEIVASAIKTPELDNLSVSEGKIIDGAVANAKIATGAVTSDKIGAGEVEEINIGDGEVTTIKLDDDAVDTDKLGVAALGIRHFSSKRIRLIDLHEEFINGVLPDGWIAAIAAGGVISPNGIRGISLLSGPGGGDDIIITGQNIRYITEGLPTFDAIVHNEQLTQRDTFIGVEDGAAKQVGFSCIAGVGGANWFARCDYADGAVLVDTGVLSTPPNVDELSFEVVSPALVRFYIGGILKASIASTMPATTPVFPKIDFAATEAGGKEMNLRLMSLIFDRT